MNCAEVQRLLEASLDGELDLVRQLELESHVRDCAACAQRAKNARTRRATLRENLPRFSAPPALAARIRAALPSTSDVAGIGVERSIVKRPLARPRPQIFFFTGQFAGLAAAIAVAMYVGFSWGGARARANRLFDEAIADHVRSLQADHLTDVASTDQHTVKPWFAGKLDFAPHVIDLAAAGFPLTGGRLERIDGQTAAALVFHRRQHAINVFVWPGSGTESSSQPYQREGYSAMRWAEGGLSYLAVSDISAEELETFAALFRSAKP